MQRHGDMPEGPQNRRGPAKKRENRVPSDDEPGVLLTSQLQILCNPAKIHDGPICMWTPLSSAKRFSTFRTGRVRVDVSTMGSGKKERRSPFGKIAVVVVAAAQRSVAAGAAWFVVCFVHFEDASIDLTAVQLRNGALRVSPVHLDKSETARLPRIPVCYDGGGRYWSDGAEKGFEIGVGHGPRQVAYVKFH